MDLSISCKFSVTKRFSSAKCQPATCMSVQLINEEMSLVTTLIPKATHQWNTKDILNVIWRPWTTIATQITKSNALIAAMWVLDGTFLYTQFYHHAWTSIRETVENNRKKNYSHREILHILKQATLWLHYCRWQEVVFLHFWSWNWQLFRKWNSLEIFVPLFIGHALQWILKSML